MGATLGTRLARRDQERFVGRARELEGFAELFTDDPPANVVFVHGPGGIGKSTLLREVARRGAAAGWSPRWVEGRDLPPVPDALDDALAATRGEDRPLLVLDTYERMAALGGHLRGSVLPSLSERALVVIASRRAPERGWFEGGWESLVRHLELGGLSRDESLELLRASGVEDGRAAEAIAAWAQGSPLALTLAAETEGAEPDDEEVLGGLVRRLAEADLASPHGGALAVASIARVTTVELLRDVLPGTDAEDAYAWLASRTFAEPLGEGVALHTIVARALRADLRRREGERERELRRRIADHLYARAVDDRLLLSIDIQHLVEDPVVGWGYSWRGSVSYRIDDVREGDAETVGARLRERRHEAWWRYAERFFHEAPERVGIARDSEDALAGYLISVTPRTAPAFADDDPLLGPWLRHARAASPEGNAVLWHDSVDFSGDPASGVQAMLGMAGILRSGLANPRYAYMPVNRSVPGAAEFSAALGARHLEELDLELGGISIECHVLDYGPGGLLGFQRDFVYREVGLAPPSGTPPPTAVGPVAADPEHVREALRNLRLPHKLAGSPLARGDDQEERAESVRALMRRAADEAFGETENERLLRRVLVRGYLDPAPSHELAAEELNLSRAAYFRRLKSAAERVSDWLAAPGARPSGR